MKSISTLLLVGSLGLNVALAWFMLSGDRAEPGANQSPVIAAQIADPAKPLDASIWPELHTTELPTLIGRLQEAGFPPHVVRAVVIGQLSESFTARRKALEAGSARTDFWKSGVTMDPKTRTALVELNREMESTIRNLLGPDPDEQTDLSLSFLPPEKVRDLRRAREQMIEKQIALSASGTITSMQYEAMRKEERDAIAAVLTPAELLEYDLRNSDTARNLRTRLAAFSPSEQEFRSVFQLQAEFDERFSNMARSMSQEDMRARMEAEKNLAEQIKAVLGPERAEEYARKTDYNYVRTSQLVARLELPPETADQLFALQKEYQERRMEQARSGTVRNREQYMEDLAAMQKEAAERVNALLRSPSAAEAYKQYGGQWLESLVPRTAPRDATGGPVIQQSVISIPRG